MNNKSKEVSGNYCCISQCRNYKNAYAKIELYPLPGDLLRREKFCEILGIPKYVGSNPAARVCALHFKSKVGNYRPPAPTIPQAILKQPVALMLDDGRRLNFKPILPRMQTGFFPAPLQQPVTMIFNPTPSTNVLIPETLNDTNIDADKSFDNDSLKKENNPCEASDVTLQLECEEDLLSTTQLSAYMKDLMDYVNANELVYRLPPPEPKGVISPLPTSSNSELDEMPPLEPLFKNTSSVSNPVTLSSSSSIPNSPFVHILPANKGINVVTNSFSLFKNTISSPCKVETTTTSSTSVPLFFNSPVLTPRTVANTVSDKNPALIGVIGKQANNLSIGGNLSSNGLASQLVQTSTVVSSNAAVNIVSSAKLNSTISNPSPCSQTVVSSFLPITSNGNPFSNFSSLTTSLPTSALSKNSSGIQTNPAFQILPEKYKIVNAVSNNTAVPVMLLKAFDSNDTGQSFVKNTSSASSSPVTILGRDPDETEPCAASLCDVTLDETPEQIFVSEEQTISSNDQPTILNEANGSLSGRISVPHEVTKSPVCAAKEQMSNIQVNGQIGPVIVDVISAKEGAIEYFNTDTIPNIILDKSKNAEGTNDETPTCQLNACAKPSMDKNIYGTLDRMFSTNNCNSIFCLQKSIPVITNGHHIPSDPFHLFKIKTPMPVKRVEEAENLRKRLRQENFIPWAVWWLIQRRYMPVVHPCTSCGSKKFVVDKNDSYPDGFCWSCATSVCPVKKPIDRPAFFKRFKTYSIQELLLLTYHWACQSTLEEITQDVDMGFEKIWYYFKALQELCHQVVIKKGRLGLAPSSVVEISAVKMGDVFVLGAMDRKTRYVRLDAITELEAYQSSRHISLLENWINKHGTLISEIKLPDNCLLNVRKIASNPIILDPNSGQPHTLNISRYLQKNMSSIFGSINQHALKTNDIQGFLYELQWRVKYGKFVHMSFWSILNHIRDLNVEEGSPVQVKKGTFSCDSFSLKMNSALNFRWGADPEEVEIYSSMHLDQPAKLSGKDTKSYSKELFAGFHEYFHDIPEILGGANMITSKSLLAVKICFGESPAENDFYKSDVECLRLKLKSEGFFINTIDWLVNKGFIKNPSTCYLCAGESFLKKNFRFTDGYSSICQNEKCNFENLFKRPSFFHRYKEYAMSDVAGMIFHWVVQSDESLIIADVPMDSTKILDAWRSFQGLCSAALKRKKEKIGGEQHIVEVAMVKLGKLYILGAMDRKTKHSLLQVFPAEMGKFDNIYSILHAWILPKSIIVVDGSKNFNMHRRYDCYNLIIANTNIIDKDHSSCHVLNIKYYLLKHLTYMFGHIKTDLMRLEVVQSFLDELMWRNQYGKQSQQAFVFLMNEIFYNDLRDKSDFLDKKDPKFIPVEFKELRVVLRKVPKSVLKMYNCDTSDSSETSESPNSTLSEIAKEPPHSVHDVADDVLPIPNTAQYSIKRFGDNDDEIIFIDGDFPSNESFVNKEIKLEQSPTSVSTSSSTTSENCMNKVQPLVIKMHKKQKKFKSYLKSELEKVKKLELEKDFHDSTSDIPNTALRTDLGTPNCDTVELPDLTSSDSSHSNSWETKSTDSTVSSKRVARKRSAVFSSSAEKDETPVCIECGEGVDFSFDHFVKQFNCTDCKQKSVYTTCCSKAFFEHRGSILFGKRMPRLKREEYGLHRPVIMPSPWHCACGFNTKHGNKLASHMLNCGKRTCYYHQNVL